MSETFTRTKLEEGDPKYCLTGPLGSLTFDAVWAELTIDGDLPYWAMGKFYAANCDRALRLGESSLWGYMEVHYRSAMETGGEAR